MSKPANTRMRARALAAHVAPALARGFGGVVLTAALLAPAGTAFAMTDDDPPATRTEEIRVDIPDRSGAPTTPTPTPTPTSTAGPAHGGANGDLPDTGTDLAALWPLAASALVLTTAGTAVLVSRRRRPAQR